MEVKQVKRTQDLSLVFVATKYVFYLHCGVTGMEFNAGVLQIVFNIQRYP